MAFNVRNKDKIKYEVHKEYNNRANKVFVVKRYYFIFHALLIMPVYLKHEHINALNIIKTNGH